MQGLYILLIVGFSGFFIIWIRYQYLQWQDNKKFWKQVDAMIEQRNKVFNEALKKAFLDMTPLIIEVIQKSRKSKAQ